LTELKLSYFTAEANCGIRDVYSKAQTKSLHAKLTELDNNSCTHKELKICAFQ